LKCQQEQEARIRLSKSWALMRMWRERNGCYDSLVFYVGAYLVALLVAVHKFEPQVKVGLFLDYFFDAHTVWLFLHTSRNERHQ